MKKKFVSIILSICLIIPCIFAFSACANTPEPEDGLTSAKLSNIYKEVAISTWNVIGISDPTVNSNTQTTAVEIPDKKTETTDINNLTNIKRNANSMAGLVYLVSCLYQNSDFATTKNIAKFQANATMYDTEYNYDNIFKTSVDTENNKLFLECIAYVYSSTGEKIGEQYSNLVIEYDFTAKTFISYRLIGNVETSYYDMALTSDNKNMWFDTDNASDTFSVAVMNAKSELLQESNSVQALSTKFSSEFQTYLDAVQKAIDSI